MFSVVNFQRYSIKLSPVKSKLSDLHLSSKLKMASSNKILQTSKVGGKKEILDIITDIGKK